MLFLIRKRRLAWCLVTLLICAGAFFAIERVFPGQLPTTLQAMIRLERKLPIYSVRTAEKKIAISFDAAWGADRTDELLSILQEHQTKTTFFLVRFWVEKYPEVVKRIAAAGHEIGNHSATHPHMSKLSAEQIQAELTKTRDLITDTCGQSVPLFRPPFGEYNDSVLDNAAAVGYQTIQWSIDSLDWKPLSATEITTRVTSRIRPGSIVLFHNNGEHTPEALRGVLRFCAEQGYKVVPISELLLKQDYYIDNNGTMCPR